MTSGWKTDGAIDDVIHGQTEFDLNIHGDSRLRRWLEERTHPITAVVHDRCLNCGSQRAHRVKRNNLCLVERSESDSLINCAELSEKSEGHRMR
jgi:hypothetical protein